MKKVIEVIKEPTNLFRTIISISIALLLVSLTIVFLVMNIVPIKYILTGIFYLSVLGALLISLLYKINSVWIKVLSIVYLLIEVNFMFLAVVMYYKAGDAISSLTNTKYATINYSVITLKDNAPDILSYKDKNMGIIKDMEYSKEADREINRKIEVSIKEADNLASVVDQLFSKNIDTILIEDSYLDVLEESDAKVLDQIKTIYTFDIKVKQDDIKKDVNVKLDPFIILISGIDVAGPINTVSRSDVNIIMAVNPRTYQILLVHIPRDYYVTFHNLGTKDKLTHSGIYGIDMTVATVEDLMNIDINYYARINFSTFTSLIDSIGDIEVYNPVAFSSGGIKFNEGNITLNSKQALIFSRSRKMLTNGDLDRGKDQERVLDGIIKKMSVPNVAKKAYDILNVMNNSFVTNLSGDELKALINFELDRLPNWKLTSYNLGGTGMMTKGTPFYPYQALYVMNPDLTTIETAKGDINYINNIR